MSSTRRILLLFAGTVLLAVALAPLAKAGLEACAIVGRRPEADGVPRPALSGRAGVGDASGDIHDGQDPPWHVGTARGARYDFGRVFRRVLMAAALVLLVVWRRPLNVGAALRDAARSWRRLGDQGASGVAAGVAGAMILVWVTWLPGNRLPGEGFASLTAFLGAAAVILLAALVTAMVEEWLFRGVIFGALRREGSLARAAVLSALLFAAAHFFAGSCRTTPGFDLWVGARSLARCASDFALSAGPWFEFAGLGLFGLVLALARERGGSIWPAVGLHAGAVLALRLNGAFLHSGPDDATRWFYGSYRVINGLLGVLSLGVIVAACFVVDGLIHHGGTEDAENARRTTTDRFP